MTAEAAGVASISREEGWLVVRFGAGLTRATAMRLLVGPVAAGRPARRRDLRLEPGPDPPAEGRREGLAADPGRRRPAVRAARGSIPVA